MHVYNYTYVCIDVYKYIHVYIYIYIYTGVIRYVIIFPWDCRNDVQLQLIHMRVSAASGESTYAHVINLNKCILYHICLHHICLVYITYA